MTIYKARLNGGAAPLTLTQDLRRGIPRGPQPYTVVTPGEEPYRTPEPEAGE
jgi:soluble lytic murein transglycosylase